MSDVRAAERVEIVRSAPDFAQANWVGWLLAFLATLSFSIAPPIARVVLVAGMAPITLLLGRMVLATLLLGGTIALSKPESLYPTRHCFLIAFGAGLLNALGMVGFYFGLARMSASMASMLISLGPLFVLVLLALRGERVTYRHTIRIVLALCGVFLLVGPGGNADLVGLAWIAITIAQFALQLVVIQWYLLAYDARTVTFYLLIGMTVGTVLWGAATGSVWEPPDASGWLAIVVLGVVSTYGSRLLLFGAVGRIGGGQMSLLTPVETLLTIIWSTIFIDERLTSIQWVGGALILTSAALAVRRLGRAKWRPRWRVWMRS